LLWPPPLIVVWLGTCGLGLSMASIFPTTLSLAQGRMPISGAVTGWFFVGAGAGGMTLPWLIGQLFESIGPQVTMVILFLALLAFPFARPVYQRNSGDTILVSSGGGDLDGAGDGRMAGGRRRCGGSLGV
jgi:fucose permease